jgi:hypothetical protein
MSTSSVTSESSGSDSLDSPGPQSAQTLLGNLGAGNQRLFPGGFVHAVEQLACEACSGFGWKLQGSIKNCLGGHN